MKNKKIRQFLEKSVENIITHGDTDIFPFPVDNMFFKDSPKEVVELLEDLHKNFDQYLSNYPINQERALQVVGYFGYRWGTQIDPLWNAYLLSLVLSIADDIEESRISTAREIVFSYRYKYDKEKNSIFNRELNWRSFSEISLKKSVGKKYVIKCDISDFYPRIYHHRIENALQKATNNTEVVRRIREILSRLAKGVSYGLPVGGPASRILSELLLNRVDKLLLLEGIEFCRYADDYLIFANSIEEAYGSLIFLSEKLHENEGLSIQKSKTHIMTVEEFRSSSGFSDGNNEELSEPDKEEADFLRLRLSYDPYSPTAEEDYEELKGELKKFDIIGMLGKEINKSRINQALTRRLVNAIKYLSPKSQKTAILSIIDNFYVLYPVFPSVMILIRSVIDNLDASTKGAVFSELRELIFHQKV